MGTPHIKISVAGSDLSNFTSFDLNQSMYHHHTFELVIGHDVVEDLGSHVLDRSRAWIGEELTAEFGENEFIGVVTSINMDHVAGLNGNLIISGVSPTVFLEAGPHKQSWNDKTLQNVVEDVLGEAGLTGQVKPVFTEPITYLAQYRESHFAYLQRLAVTYNEWLFYDGKTISFGKPEPAEAIPVVYGTDLENIQISMRMLPLKVKGYSYNSIRDENLDGAGPGSVSGLNDLGSEAMAASLDKYGIEPQTSVLPRVEDKSKLEKVLANRQSAAAAGLTSIIGTGTKKELKPGAIADISAAVRMGPAWESRPYGKYLILNIQHHITGNHEYSNQFEAIPAELEVLPEPQIALPISESQIATVLSNTDPESKGRVQVQFLWQSGDMKSPWVRVMTPDAGTSDKVASNRGMVTIPEEGDQVMVGFRYNDPQRPFVMGSMFHGKSGGGGGDGNKTKSLTTRSGCTVTLDDSEGSILIMDAKQNSMTLDGEGNISISSSASITLSTGESSLSMKSDGTIDLVGVEVSVIGSKSVTNYSPKEVTINGDESVMVNSPKLVSINSTKEVVVNGTTKATVSSSATTEIQGTIIKLN